VALSAQLSPTPNSSCSTLLAFAFFAYPHRFPLCSSFFFSHPSCLSLFSLRDPAYDPTTFLLSGPDILVVCVCLSCDPDTSFVSLGLFSHPRHLMSWPILPRSMFPWGTCTSFSSFGRPLYMVALRLMFLSLFPLWWRASFFNTFQQHLPLLPKLQPHTPYWANSCLSPIAPLALTALSPAWGPALMPEGRVLLLTPTPRAGWRRIQPSGCAVALPSSVGVFSIFSVAN